MLFRNHFWKIILALVLVLVIFSTIFFFINNKKIDIEKQETKGTVLEESGVFIDDEFINNNMLYIACLAWQNQDPSYCSQFPEKYKIFADQENIKNEEKNCLAYYYETLMWLNNDISLCDNLPASEYDKCIKKGTLFTELIKEGISKDKIINLCEKNAGEGKYECLAILLKNTSYCNDPLYCEGVREKFCDYHVKNCQIFSSDPNQLNCEEFLP